MDKEIKERITNYFLDLQEKQVIRLQEENEDLQQRIDKAVEYIENDLQISILPNNQIINGTEVVKRINKVINILKGDETKVGE